MHLSKSLLEFGMTSSRIIISIAKLNISKQEVLFDYLDPISPLYSKTILKGCLIIFFPA